MPSGALRRLSIEENFESLDTAHHREVKVDDPDRIAGRHEKTFLNTGRERMGHWRGAGVEVVVVVFLRHCAKSLYAQEERLATSA